MVEGQLTPNTKTQSVAVTLAMESFGSPHTAAAGDTIPNEAVWNAARYHSRVCE